jgi:hypothetical protein
LNDILVGSYSADHLYTSLKVCPELIQLKLNNNALAHAETKAIAKVLSDFKHIKEVDFSSCSLSAQTAQDIADGLMRAKSLEVLRLSNNPSIGKGLTSIIYNLAFSPKIRVIEMENCTVADAQIAEAIYKLIKISGAVESLNMEKVDCWQYFTEDFFISLGESKTLKYLNMDSSARVNANTARLGKAIAMNARKNGSLEHVSMQNWLNGHQYLNAFCTAMEVSEQDHELWYGDKKTAQAMEKEQLVKSFHCNLKVLDLQWSHAMAGAPFRYKNTAKLSNPTWPSFLKLAASTDLILNMRDSRWGGHLDMLTYAIGENPTGACKMVSLELSKNPLRKEGAKQIAPALALNKSLLNIDLSHC